MTHYVSRYAPTLILSLMLFSSLCQADETSQRIQELKEEILEIAFAAQGAYDSDDGSLEVRQHLDPLIDELVSLSPSRTEQEKMIDVIGTWYQVWSDGPSDNYTGQPGQGALGDSIWQVIFPQGYFWNVARSQYGDNKSMSYLRGSYALGFKPGADCKKQSLCEDDRLTTEITKAVFNPQWSFAEPTRLAMLAEFGAYDKNPTPYPPEISPIGKRSSLRNVFVDEDVRIVRGEETKLEKIKRTKIPRTGNGFLVIYERD